MAQSVRTDTTSNNNWWADLWNGIASAIGWITVSIGANQCTGENEYYNAKLQKCVAIPNCGPGTHLDEKTMSCVPDIGAGSISSNTWLIIGGIAVVGIIVLIVFLKR